MSLRLRLVLSLVALLAAGMAVYGYGTYQAFANAEMDRLDDDLAGTWDVADRELINPDELSAPEGFEVPHDRDDDLDRPGPGHDAPRVVLTPGTYAELRAADGTVVDAITFTEGDALPDLSSIGGPGYATVDSVDGGPRWRVLADEDAFDNTVVVAVPLGGVESSLDRLLLIEVAAGAALLAVLGAGATLVLRRGLRPLERMAETAGSITAGRMDRRVEDGGTATETRQLAAAFNGMLDDLEDAFREREAQEAKLRRFLADASHELRTPLTSIRGFAELFRLGADSEHTDLPTIMRRIEQESDRMKWLVEDLLTLARLDELHPVETTEIDLAVLAADACADAVATAPDRPVRLDAPEPVVVRANVGHLRQALVNLVANAIRHTPEGTAIEVAARIEQGRPVLRVRDHGQGLDDEAIAHVFDRFWQADPARVGTGSGLGLAIVESIATEHDGSATATNAPDGGAVFTVTLSPDHLATPPGS